MRIGIIALIIMTLLPHLVGAAEIAPDEIEELIKQADSNLNIGIKITNLDQEKVIFEAQAAESGKPAEIVAKMVEGRIKKYLEEVSLVCQNFIKNPDVKIADLLKQHKAKVLSFTRYELGEGIEKVEVDFRAEVMGQVKSAA